MGFCRFVDTNSVVLAWRMELTPGAGKLPHDVLEHHTGRLRQTHMLWHVAKFINIFGTLACSNAARKSLLPGQLLF